MKTKIKTNTRLSFGAGLRVRAAVRVGFANADDYVDTFLAWYPFCEGDMDADDCVEFAQQFQAECEDDCFSSNSACAQQCVDWNAYLFQSLRAG